MTTPDIAAVVRGLTKAQRALLCRMRPDEWHEAYYLRSSADVWSPGASLTRLAAKGMVDRRDHLLASPTLYRLTDDGLAVRDRLLEGRVTQNLKDGKS